MSSLVRNGFRDTTGSRVLKLSLIIVAIVASAAPAADFGNGSERPFLGLPMVQSSGSAEGSVIEKPKPVSIRLAAVPDGDVVTEQPPLIREPFLINDVVEHWGKAEVPLRFIWQLGRDKGEQTTLSVHNKGEVFTGNLVLQGNSVIFLKVSETESFFLGMLQNNSRVLVNGDLELQVAEDADGKNYLRFVGTPETLEQMCLRKVTETILGTSGFGSDNELTNLIVHFVDSKSDGLREFGRLVSPRVKLFSEALRTMAASGVETKDLQSLVAGLSSDKTIGTAVIDFLTSASSKMNSEKLYAGLRLLFQGTPYEQSLDFAFQVAPTIHNTVTCLYDMVNSPGAVIGRLRAVLMPAATNNPL